MADTLTPAKGLAKQTIGGNSNTWGTVLNNNFGLIDSALGGTLTKSISGDTTLSSTEIENTGFYFTGTLTGAATITFPAFHGLAALQNATTGGYSVSCEVSGGTAVAVLNGESVAVWSDGSDFVRLHPLPITETATVNVQDYGAKCDGSIDDTAAVNRAIATVAAAGGGTVFIPGHCVMQGALTIPYTGTNPPQQKPLRITGLGAAWDGTLSGASSGGGSTLDLRYDGTDGTHVAKIDTRGAGILEIDHLTIQDGGSSNALFVQTTNTTLHIHDCHFIGNTANSGTACVQDAIRLGGITNASSALGGVLATNGFQGYGSEIHRNLFSRFRRVFTFGGSANAIEIKNNTIDTTCGSSETTGAPYMFLGVGLGTTGNVISGIVEQTHYPYAVAMLSSGGFNQGNQFAGLGIYDATVGSPAIAGYYFSDANSFGNIICPTYITAGMPLMAGSGATKNLYLDPFLSPGALTLGARIGGATLVLDGGNSNNGDGGVVLFRQNGTTAGAIGTRGTISGLDHDPSLQLYSSNGKYYISGAGNWDVVATDANGKLFNQGKQGSGGVPVFSVGPTIAGLTLQGTTNLPGGGSIGSGGSLIVGAGTITSQSLDTTTAPGFHILQIGGAQWDITAAVTTGDFSLKINGGQEVIHGKRAGTNANVLSVPNGDFQIGAGTSALAANATLGFLGIPAGHGPPTGAPDNRAAGIAQVYYDTDNHKLWVYDFSTLTWMGVVLS